MCFCWRDLSKECEGKYKDCTDCVLDKIRVEIKAMSGDIETIADVLAIIDKYKAESEKTDADND